MATKLIALAVLAIFAAATFVISFPFFFLIARRKASAGIQESYAQIVIQHTGVGFAVYAILRAANRLQFSPFNVFVIPFLTIAIHLLIEAIRSLLWRTRRAPLLSQRILNRLRELKEWDKIA